MRLLLAELRKVWGRRVFLVLLGALLLLNLFLVYNASRPAQGVPPPEAYRAMEQKLQGLSRDEKRAFLAEEWARIEALNRMDYLRTSIALGWWSATDPMIEYNQLYETWGQLYESGEALSYGSNLVEEYQFLRLIKAEFEQVDGYEAFLDDIHSKATQLSGISIFATEGANSFEEQNITAAAKAYEGMRGVAIDYSPQKGLTTALGFELTDLLLLFTMLLLASMLVRQERDSGLLGLVRATPRGRMPTAAAKLGALAISLLAVLVLLYGCNLLFCGGLYGLGDLGRSVQSVPALMRSTLRLNVGGYLGAWLLAKWAAAAIAGAWVMLAALLARRAAAGYALGLALPAVSLLLRQFIPGTSHFNVLKYANLASFLVPAELLGGTRSLYWFGSPAPITLVEGVAALLLAAGFVVAFLLVFARAQLLPAARRGFAPAWRLPGKKRAATLAPSGHAPDAVAPAPAEAPAGSAPATARRAKRARPGAGILRQEAYKLFIMNGAALVLVLLLGYGVVQGVRSQSYLSPDEIYYRRYMTILAGPVTQDKADWLTEEKQRFMPLIELEAQYAAHEISEYDYYNKMNQYWALSEEMNSFARVVGQYNILRTTPGSQFVYTSGYPQLFGLAGTGDITDTLLTAVACALCFAGLFAMEQSTGMVRVIGATPLGRSATAKRKLRLAALGCGVITLAVALPRWWQVLRDYGFSAPFAPLSSLDAYPDAPAVATLLGLAVCTLLARFVAALAMAAVALALGQKLGNAFAAMFCTSALFALPPLLALAGLPGAQWAGPYPLLHFGWMMTATPTAVAGWLALALWGGVALLCWQWLCGRFGKAGGRA
ncbi:MAG: hypothetical protein GXY32_02110 [Ruminococcaceae bacterium]|nr:hypothetical protein [Oscillospiraceae bacterium]